MGNKPGLQPGLVFSCRCAPFKKADTRPEAIPQACVLPSPLLTVGLQTFMYGVLSTLLSGQFSHSVVSDSLRPHESQHSRPPCLSPTPGVHSDSCPSSQWYHPTVSSSVFSSHLQFFPASGSFQISQLFASGGQSIGIFGFNISPSNEHSGLISFRMDWLDLLAVQGTLKGLLQHHSSKASILWHSAFFIVQLSHPYMWNYWKNHSFD